MPKRGGGFPPLLGIFLKFVIFPKIGRQKYLRYLGITLWWENFSINLAK
jgi:hypothetical protein